MTAQRIITPKKPKTNGQEPIMFRMRSAARSPVLRSSPDRTPGCLCQWDSHLVLLMHECFHDGRDSRVQPRPHRCGGSVSLVPVAPPTSRSRGQARDCKDEREI
jgi:hypothetical protein